MSNIYLGDSKLGTRVKGSAESTYREGDVNITPANLGITVVNNTKDANKSVKYATSAGSATKATQDGNGNNIANTYATMSQVTTMMATNKGFIIRNTSIYGGPTAEDLTNSEITHLNNGGIVMLYNSYNSEAMFIFNKVNGTIYRYVD